jgi:hypothetical protein
VGHISAFWKRKANIDFRLAIDGRNHQHQIVGREGWQLQNLHISGGSRDSERSGSAAVKNRLSSDLFQLRTPVALLTYNRPELTARVFAAISKAKPAKLLVVADGPRVDRPGDVETCAATRKIIDRVDWPCEVLTNFADTNLGCRLRISSGLDWVFGIEDKAIILEDDCLPSPSFFRFCQELLARFRDDERIMHIGGNNFVEDRIRFNASYYFSRYPRVWGWASWRRAWRHYDVEMKLWTSAPSKDAYLNIFPTKNEKMFWRHVWDDTCRGKIDTWAYQWAFACMARKGFAISPALNLVSNIGIGREATHTKDPRAVPRIPARDLVFPIKHPPALKWLDEADDLDHRRFFSYVAIPMSRRAINRIARLLMICSLVMGVDDFLIRYRVFDNVPSKILIYTSSDIRRAYSKLREQFG